MAMRPHLSIALHLSLAAASVFLVAGASGCKDDAPSTATKAAVTDAAPTAIPTVTMLIGHDAGPPVDGSANALGIPEDVLRAALNPAGLPEYSGPVGEIDGTVLIDGEPSPPRKEKAPSPKCPESAVLYAKAFREGPANDKGQRPLADAAIGVIDPTPTSTFYVAAKNRAETLTLTGCAPSSRTIAMTFGQSLDVANRGTKITAPQLQPTPTVALMVAPPGGDPVHLYPPKPGHYRLIDMMQSAALDQDVYVFQFALHDVSDERGHFHVRGVPAGKRRVFAHLPATNDEASIDVDVPANGTATVEILLHQTVKDAPSVDAGSAPH